MDGWLKEGRVNEEDNNNNNNNKNNNKETLKLMTETEELEKSRNTTCGQHVISVPHQASTGSSSTQDTSIFSNSDQCATSAAFIAHSRKRKRTISEVQLMHNVREHKQVGERQDWLQGKLKDIIVASAKPEHGQSGNLKNLFPNDVLGINMWKS
ncbi:Parathyroid hormone [Collichthys lucidus]|uniref:Parathyroid hormone n=1 Tax=Collichthys lucidus TaxID=240159 RepID=A0A4U5U8H6_COLLU|nr:Parathyroid hormone [Collichthys lucidus]